MTRGYITIAQNLGDVNYVRMAYALALSIKASQRNNQFAVCVSKKDDVPDEYRRVFDHVIEIPWGDDAETSDWKLENLWKLVHMTPFDETICLDADMIFTDNIDHWWDVLQQKEMWATTNPVTFRGETITSDYYRKAFTSNNLPNIYGAFMYFRKTEMVHEIFDLTREITQNWGTFFDEFLPENKPRFFSTDVAFALAIRILGLENEVTNNHCKYLPTFLHMKSYVQNIPDAYLTEDWTKHISSSFSDDCILKIGNYTQKVPVHYHIKEWLTDSIIRKLERKVYA